MPYPRFLFYPLRIPWYPCMSAPESPTGVILTESSPVWIKLSWGFRSHPHFHLHSLPHFLGNSPLGRRTGKTAQAWLAHLTNTNFISSYHINCSSISWFTLILSSPCYLSPVHFLKPKRAPRQISMGDVQSKCPTREWPPSLPSCRPTLSLQESLLKPSHLVRKMEHSNFILHKKEKRKATTFFLTPFIFWSLCIVK